MVRSTAYGAALGAALLVLAAPAALALTTTPPPEEPVSLGGSPVEGGTAQVPTDLAAGLWSGTLVGPGGSPATTQWFRYHRTMADSTVLVGAVATSAEEAGDQLEVSVRTGAMVCDDDTSSSGSAAPSSAYGVLAVAGVDEDGDRDSVCVSSPTLDIAVSRGTASAESDQPFALRIVEEPLVVGDRGPVPAEEPRVARPSPGEPTPLAGGSSFDDAPEVGNGTYSDEVPEGVERLWKVRLDWGESLAVRLDVPPQDAADAATLGGGGPQVSLTPFNPLRDSFGDAVADTEDQGAYDPDEPTTLFEGAPPVAYLNRYDGITATVPGDYWVSVAVSPVSSSSDREPVDVPVELTVEVGEPSAGGPGFPETVTGPAGAPAPDGYAEPTPYLVDDGVFSADVSGTPRIRDEAGSGSGGGADDGTRRTAGLVLGGLSLVALAAGVVSLRRRAATR